MRRLRNITHMSRQITPTAKSKLEKRLFTKYVVPFKNTMLVPVMVTEYKLSGKSLVTSGRSVFNNESMANVPISATWAVIRVFFNESSKNVLEYFEALDFSAALSDCSK